MSNADPEEAVTASNDGVTIEKSFEPDDFPVPAIAFLIRSERNETVSIRLVDSVPSHVPPEDIGFHPKFGAEFWDVEDDTIVFERDFEPGEEYTTVYGLRGGDADDVEKFMSEPNLEYVDPPLEESDAGQTVRDVIGEDAEQDDEIATAVGEVDAEGDADADARENGETPDDAEGSGIEEAGDGSIDLSEPDESGAGAAATDAGTAPTDAAAASAGGESLVSALAAEIRSGDVDDEAVDELRDALGVDLASASVEARIEHLQSTVSDIEAYADSLEEFLDENGDAQRLIGDVQEDFEEAKERFDEIEATAESAAETAESVDDRLDERFEELDSRVDEELADVESRVDEELADVESRVDEALEDIEDVDEVVEERLEDELDELWSAVDEASTEAADVAGELRAFREQIDDDDTDERVDELETEMEELSGELEDVAEMRDRLASALGGIAPQDDRDDAGDADGSDDSPA